MARPLARRKITVWRCRLAPSMRSEDGKTFYRLRAQHECINAMPAAWACAAILRGRSSPHPSACVRGRSQHDALLTCTPGRRSGIDRAPTPAGVRKALSASAGSGSPVSAVWPELGQIAVIRAPAHPKNLRRCPHSPSRAKFFRTRAKLLTSSDDAGYRAGAYALTVSGNTASILVSAWRIERLDDVLFTPAFLAAITFSVLDSAVI